MGLAAAGRTSWTVSRLGADALPHTPLISAVFVAGIVTGTAALLSAVSAPRSGLGRARVVLDGVTCGSCSPYHRGDQKTTWKFHK